MYPIHCIPFLLLILLSSCSSSSETDDANKQRYQKGEYIYRKHDEFLFEVGGQVAFTPKPYPWEENRSGNHIKITKEFFRCKGSSLNPIKNGPDKNVTFSDCGGAEKHSLPLRENKEFIYPILIDLLNYIQSKTNKKVVITSGHRCPDHNLYVDQSKSNQYSKHMIGAEASFYVQGLEDRPDIIVKLIMDYYKQNAKYENKKEYINFERYSKGDADVSTQPWYNKEIFVKLFHKKEGRNFDNRHPYPYISVQVRYDWDLKEKVIYTWDKATHNFLRN